MKCPRRAGMPKMPEYTDRIDDTRHDHTCNFCGSLTGDKFMELIKGGAVVGSTDKNYKVYVYHPDYPHAKFYFQHLSNEQMLEFVEMYNAKTIKFDGGEGLYVLPFFCKIEE